MAVDDPFSVELDANDVEGRSSDDSGRSVEVPSEGGREESTAVIDASMIPEDE